MVPYNFPAEDIQKSTEPISEDVSTPEIVASEKQEDQHVISTPVKQKISSLAKLKSKDQAAISKTGFEGCIIACGCNCYIPCILYAAYCHQTRTSAQAGKGKKRAKSNQREIRGQRKKNILINEVEDGSIYKFCSSV